MTRLSPLSKTRSALGMPYKPAMWSPDLSMPLGRWSPARAAKARKRFPDASGYRV
ncbi:hypothetical protein ACFFX0_19010 [Citricoccus parietis]|uniref:DUF4113 domain-containing protein n=1 Tax=Citricoccus parietis TaxID=592307 RepID=A0ABV5G3E4_9MICC